LRIHADSVDCGTLTSRESDVALTARGPDIRSTIFLNVSEYSTSASILDGSVKFFVSGAGRSLQNP